MELIKETVNINETVCKGTTQVMAEGDVIVPDTKPDILKLLQVDAIACVTDKETLTGTAKIHGRADMTILYIPDKENERIRSINTSVDFSQRIDNEKISPDMKLMTQVNVERVEFSALNSRKLRIKAIVEIQYEVLDPRTVEISSEVEADEEIEVKKEKISVDNIADLSEHEFIVKESLEVPNGQTSIGEILKVDVVVTDTEYKTITGKIVAKGILSVCVLYTDNEGSVNFMEEEIPFTEVFEAPDAGEETVCDIDYCIKNISYAVSEDSDGDERIVGLEIEVCAQIRACDSVDIEMISDCFVPLKKTSCETTEFEIEETVATPSVQNTIREVIEFPAGAPGVECVYNCVARPYVTKTQVQKNKLLCEGRIEVYILYLSDSSENPVYSVKKDIPFSYMMDIDAEVESCEANVRADVRHTSYNLNAAGEVEVRCIVSISANVMKKRKINLIDDITVNEPVSNERGGIVIYFVQNGDELWNVAKHYRVPREAIIKFNGLSDDALKQGQRLFIPAGR